jgi:excisionase family DNA binding protein
MTEEERDAEREAVEGGAGQERFPEVMTVKQAAEYLQVNEQVLYRYVREGKVPVAKMGTTIRFKRSVLDQWLERDSWESVGQRPPAERGERPEASRPRLDMEID